MIFPAGPARAAVLLLALALVSESGAARAPILFAVGGPSRSTPFGPAQGAWGYRAGLSLAASLRAGDIRIPLEWGLSGRVATLGFDGGSYGFDRDLFTEIQMPFLFHGSPGWKPLELVAAYIPSYTLDMVSESPRAGKVSYRESLRTRFNMGFGGGMQFRFPLGFALRGIWIYNIFSPYPASRLTWGEWNLEAAVPLVFRKKAMP